MQLERAYYASAGYNLLLLGEMERILQAFDSAGIQTVALKGAALAGWLYPEAALRPMIDLDLLVRQNNLEESIRIIEGLGYRKQKVTYHVMFYGGPHKRLTLELHWQVGSEERHETAAVTEWFWGQAAYQEQRGWVFSPAASLLYLAGHLIYQHGESSPRLIWFYDIYLLAKKSSRELDWDELGRQAKALGWNTALYHALAGVQQRFGLELPESFLLALAGSLSPASRQSHPGLPAGVERSESAQIRQAIGSLEWRTRLRLLAGLLFPSGEYLRWRYRPRPVWLWPLGYPRRWWEMLRDEWEMLSGRG